MPLPSRRLDGAYMYRCIYIYIYFVHKIIIISNNYKTDEQNSVSILKRTTSFIGLNYNIKYNGICSNPVSNSYKKTSSGKFCSKISFGKRLTFTFTLIRNIRLNQPYTLA